jgi:hypothetical protein
MTQWIRDSFSSDSVNHVAQVRAAPTGAVLKIYGTCGTYFLKTLPSFLSYEARLAAALHARFPAALADILPLLPNEDSYVTCAIAGRPLSSIGDREQWSGVFVDIANMQIATARFLDELELSGVPTQTFRSFAAGLDKSLATVVRMQKGLANELTDEELAKLPTLVGLAQRDCDALEQCGLPETVVHGEPSESNIFVTPAGAKFIDWAFSRISHPFFMLQTFYLTLNSPTHRMHSDWERFKEAYLDPWQEYTTREKLRKGLDAASRLMWIDSMQHLVKFFQLLEKE